ncbi:putative fucosyltransferase 4 [Raphanus sativus]|uniref:Fucosyltransferase n=1 Tax=Raphanus sativus TaxID=3726 RepID=A0A6J0KV52_RAPSA|nr:probable fucosyltransferase 9 [Raphanus sativus]KAJ4879305.1 putative fucosyltransferase 4 [Raphanus sativus]
MYHILQISGYVFRALGLKMKILITFTFSALLIGFVILLSFSSNFNYQLPDATLNGSTETEPLHHDKLLGGLLKPGFDEASCESRYTQSLLYRKPSPHKPSPYLVSKLRSYELLHKRCGPGTKSYKKATKNLGHDDDDDDEDQVRTSDKGCRYVVWVATDYGLGNRMISMVSLFLYALLTERIMLVDQRKDIISDLFCEPFPDTSWLLPLDFPLIGQIGSYYREHSRCYGTMLKNHAINSTTVPPLHLYLHLIHDYRDLDKTFFCEQNQNFIDNVPWLVVKSNLYFAPSLWLIPSFQTELIKLFPRKDTVFHHLTRYLFHPTNQVWGMVTSTYNANLSKADEVLGLQIRVFSTPSGYFQHVMDQVVSCTQREKLLPKTPKVKAVLVASLHPEYSDELRNVFSERTSSTGEIIEVYQPSGERVQQTDEKLHDQRALAEIYLLSLTDKLVTSRRSTFGYVAHGLGGLKPWILYKPDKNVPPDPPCVRARSMEPCFIRAPLRGCQAKKIKTAPFLRHCEDWNPGIKLVDAPDRFWWWWW